jgi:hypothetical protein
MLEQFLGTLAEELVLDGVPKKEPGNLFQLELNPETQLVLQELDPGISLWGKIGPCPEVKKEELFMQLSKANFLGQGTGGACIGLEESGNFLTLSLVLPYDMNYKMFRDALEDFTNYLDYWKEELIRHKNAAEATLL